MSTTLALAVLVAVAYGVQTTAGFGAGLILVTIGGSIGGSLFLYLSCRFCMCCPLYRRKLHEKRVLSMSIGQRL